MVAQYVNGVLAGLAPVTAAVGGSIANLMVVPEGMALPAAIHYAETGDYTGPVHGDIDAEQIRYLVRFICQGQSSDPIRAAALAMVRALNDTQASGSVADTDGRSWFVSLTAVGEWPITTTVDNGVFYRQLGTYFQVDVTSGG